MSEQKFSALEGLYHMSPICTAWLWGAALFIEAPALVASAKYLLIPQYSGYFIVCMVLGFAVNVVTYLVIKQTNAVTLKIMGTARNAGLVWFGVLFQGDIVNMSQLIGYGIALGFFFLYSYYKTNKL